MIAVEDTSSEAGPPGAWARRAGCAGVVDQVDFFALDRATWAASVRLCVGCPVRRECLQYALDATLLDGVWGGLTPPQLRFALGRNADGKPWAYGKRYPVRCPHCRAATTAVKVAAHSSAMTCTACGLAWTRAHLAFRRRRPVVEPQPRSFSRGRQGTSLPTSESAACPECGGSADAHGDDCGIAGVVAAAITGDVEFFWRTRWSRFGDGTRCRTRRRWPGWR